LNAAADEARIAAETERAIAGNADEVADGAKWVDGKAAEDAAAVQNVSESAGEQATKELGETGATTAAKSPPCASFRSDTLILMADGTRKPIGEVSVGDDVVATDPSSGVTSVRKVTKLWTHIDDDLVDLKVLSRDGTDYIHTTDHHLFRSVTRDRWVEVRDLSVGERLFTLDGDVVAVRELKGVPGSGRMLDLSVELDHTFYVALGETNLLVHNQSCPMVQLADDIAGGNVTYGKNFEAHLRSHADHIRTAARDEGIQIAKSPGKASTKASMMEYIENIVKNPTNFGVADYGSKTVFKDAIWSMRGNLIVVRKASGEFITVLVPGKGAALWAPWVLRGLKG
jgi:Pretoxin HINT domain